MGNLLIGKKAIIEQLSKDNVLSVHSLHLIPEIKKICDKKNIVYIIQEKDFFNNFSSNHQGIIAYIKNTDYLTENLEIFWNRVNNNFSEKKIILVLDKIEDTRNFGAIIRTADAFGVDGIIIKKNNQAEINENVIKSSIGSIFNSNILRTSNLTNVIDFLKKNNFWIVATTLEEAENVNNIKFNFNTCLIIGNENKGVSQNLIKKADFKAKILMYVNVQSLNVSVATGIILNHIKNCHSKE